MENQTKNTLQDINKQLYFSFTLDFSLELTEKEKALLYLFQDLDFKEFKISRLGRKNKINPSDLALIVVYSYMEGKESSREIEQLTNRDMFIRSLLGPITSIDHTTINRFIKNNKEAIENLFYQIVKKLEGIGELSKTTVFQDGTKIESRANKYTFVWKKGLEKNIDKTINRLIKYCEMAKDLGLLERAIIINENNCYPILRNILTIFKEDELCSLFKEIGRGRGHKINPIGKLLKSIKQDIEKLREQEKTLLLIGKERNSLSKTDIDATFMRMKEDYMGNGQLKPAYNIQNAVDSGYIICTTISSDRADYYTAVPTLEKINEKLDWSYSSYVADSGYDCNENFRYLEKNNIKAFIKPQDWEITKKRKYKDDISKYQNMEYNKKENFFVCANNKKLYPTGRINKRHGVPYIEYKCKRGCKSCPFRNKCIKKTELQYKSFSLNLEHYLYRKKAYELLLTEEGIEARINRSIQAEGSFAQIKSNMGKRRFSCFGKDRVFTEWILFSIALNVNTFASRLAANKVGSPQWYSPPKEPA